MPANNIYHAAVIASLIADGWIITDDPFTLSYGGRDLFVDLGAEQAALSAEKAGRKIAVEIQSFLRPSPVESLQQAVGQYEIYRAILAEVEPDRPVYLALPKRVHEGILSEQLGRLLVDRLKLKILVFDEIDERIIKWIE